MQPATPATLDVINPATEQPFATIALGAEADVDRAVAAASAAFDGFAATSREERIALLGRIVEVYMARAGELAPPSAWRWALPPASRRTPRSPPGSGTSPSRSRR